MDFPTNTVSAEELQKIIGELNTWCMNYRGFINQVFSEQVTMEEKVTKLFWCVKQIAETQKGVVTEWSELYNWVDNYFKNLNLQPEVDKKLEEMAQDGTLNKIINEEIFGAINTKVDKNAQNITSLQTRMSNAENNITSQGGRITALEGLWLKGKRAVFFGDSLTYGELVGTGGQQSPNNYPATFGKLTGCEVVNYGHSGDKAVDCLNIVRSHSSELSNFDYIFINIGVNDFLGQTPVGWLDCLDQKYFNGQINAIFNALQAGRGGKTQVIALSFMPNHEMWNEWFDKVSWLTYKANYDYCAMVSGIPIINMAKASGISEFNSGKYMNADGLHFTNDGYALLGKTIASCMMSGYYYNPKVGMSENQLKPWSFVNDYSSSDAIKNFGVYYRNGIIRIDDKEEHQTVNQFSYEGEEFCFLFTVRSGLPGKVCIGFPGYPRLGKIDISTGGLGNATYLIKTKNTIGENTYLGWSVQFETEEETTGTATRLTNLCLKYGPGEYPGFAKEEHFDLDINFEDGISSDKMPCRIIQKDFEIQMNGYFYNTTKAIPANSNILNLNAFPWVRRQNTAKTYLVYCGGNDGNMYVFNCESGYLKNLKQIPQGVIIGLNAVLYL